MKPAIMNCPTCNGGLYLLTHYPNKIGDPVMYEYLCCMCTRTGIASTKKLALKEFIRPNKFKENLLK